jgi:anhydro-N-acetylmuramic acid kinase
MKQYNIIGIMSGTSCDGLDIAFCSFFKENNFWKFEIIKAETKKYHEIWLNRIRNAFQLDAFEFIKLHNDYGVYIGNTVKEFCNRYSLNPDFVSSHGHTIFHQPDINLTFQIGNGAYIAASCELNVISDFRTMDVALSGQGAPLVPIGDELLFSQYDYCLNLGGFANISCKKEDKRIAYDVCPVNIVMNEICQNKLQIDFDRNGDIASTGNINDKLLQNLNEIEYYKKLYPKSLGKEWLDREFMPIINSYELSVGDLLRTICEHISEQIANVIDKKNASVFVTGGGAYNNFLIKRLRQKSTATVIIPDDNLIQFKEALIFAFLGVLRLENEYNCLKSVTGAKKDCFGGIIHLY